MYVYICYNAIIVIEYNISEQNNFWKDEIKHLYEVR